LPRSYTAPAASTGLVRGDDCVVSQIDQQIIRASGSTGGIGRRRLAFLQKLEV
jgi:hypothetical protein